MRRSMVWAAVAAVLVVALVLIWTFLRVDDCLDRGGSWNYDTEVCET
jgi:hypothetical protein